MQTDQLWCICCVNRVRYSTKIVFNKIRDSHNGSRANLCNFARLLDLCCLHLDMINTNVLETNRQRQRAHRERYNPIDSAEMKVFIGFAAAPLCV